MKEGKRKKGKERREKAQGRKPTHSHTQDSHENTKLEAITYRHRI